MIKYIGADEYECYLSSGKTIVLTESELQEIIPDEKLEELYTQISYWKDRYDTVKEQVEFWKDAYYCVED